MQNEWKERLLSRARQPVSAPCSSFEPELHTYQYLVHQIALMGLMPFFKDRNELPGQSGGKLPKEWWPSNLLYTYPLLRVPSLQPTSPMLQRGLRGPGPRSKPMPAQRNLRLDPTVRELVFFYDVKLVDLVEQHTSKQMRVAPTIFV